MPAVNKLLKKNKLYNSIYDKQSPPCLSSENIPQNNMRLMLPLTLMLFTTTLSLRVTWLELL